MDTHDHMSDATQDHLNESKVKILVGSQRKSVLTAGRCQH